MDILKRINKLRIEKGWSIYRLSEEAGLPQSTVSNMFNRGTLPSLSSLQSICSALNITMAEFFEEDKPNGEINFTKEEFDRIYENLSLSDRKIIFTLMRALSDK